MSNYIIKLHKLRAFLLPVVILGAWEIAALLHRSLGISSTLFIVVPPPSQIVTKLALTVTGVEVISAVGRTLLTTTLGFSLGIVGTVGFGSLIGASRRAAAYMAPTFHTLRSVPIALYIPIALVLLGSSLGLPIALASFITILYGAVPVSRAVEDYDHEKTNFLSARGYSRPAIVVNFVLPEIAAALYTSIRITSTLAISVTVVSEMLFTSLGGLGSLVIQAKQASQYVDLWALTFLLGLVGFVFQWVIVTAWRFALPWVSDA
jgi:ABC-type nitrate/sulfonate/bicarbonate transport system permease component